MNRFFLPIILLLLYSCNSKRDGWQTLDFSDFKLQTPVGWKIIKQQGIDSYIGGLTNGRDTLEFDYGWYTQEIGEEDPNLHKFGQVTINGLTASIVIPSKPGEGYIGMYMPTNDNDKFGIRGHNISST